MKSIPLGALVATISLVFSASTALAAESPLPGVNVLIKDQTNGHLIYEGPTDANGQYSIRSIPSGAYVVEVRPSPEFAQGVAEAEAAGAAQPAITQRVILVSIRDKVGRTTAQRYDLQSLRWGISLLLGVSRLADKANPDNEITLTLLYAPEEDEDLSC